MMRTCLAMTWLTLGLAACASNGSGVAPVRVSNETVAAVQSRLRAQGYHLWYPAQEGVEPGEVWREDSGVREKLFGRPQSLFLERPRGASFLLGFETTSNSFSANLGAVIGFLGGDLRDDQESLAKLKGALQRHGVTKLHFKFVDASLRRFPVDYLDEPDVPQGYREHVLNTDPPGVLYELVETSGLVVHVTFADAEQETDAREALGNALGIELASSPVSERQFEWTVPPGKAFTFGVKYLTSQQVEKVLG